MDRKLIQVRHRLPFSYLVYLRGPFNEIKPPTNFKEASGDCHYRQVGRTRPRQIIVIVWRSAPSICEAHPTYKRRIFPDNDASKENAARRKLPRMLTRSSRASEHDSLPPSDYEIRHRRFSEKIIVANWDLIPDRERSFLRIVDDARLVIAHPV